MSRDAREWLEKQQAAQARQREALPELSHEERRALRKLRHEAKRAGALLANRGRGGLSPSFVLALMRRDGYRCTVHGDRGEGHNGGLTLHHIDGESESTISKWLGKKRRGTGMDDLVTLCTRAHDAEHAGD